MTRDEAKAAGLKHYSTGKPCLRGHVSERFVSTGQCCPCLIERSQTPEAKAEKATRQRQPEAKAKDAAYRKANAEKIAGYARAYARANAEKIASKQATYRKANREKRAVKRAAYRKANAEKIAGYARAYARANAERIAAKDAAYQKANAEKIAAKRAAYQKANPHVINAITAKRRAAKRQATPPWADFEAIKAVYRLCADVTRITGEQNHVDHIYPLVSDEVCGLHVAANLQILTATDNLKKSNKLLPMYEMPEQAI